ncbi:hypothetical protein FKR81_20135 [Lentzea tibetensis]|uniref:HTH luxR-type domain-containing protein n=1 Tax=Lentzea tibetensis TaxID=2591470 RepID=A0A563ES32_9PSEU|nr:LuxR C-terminal-related transcriptional regulator [Lentzea tibetensis]TWP50486.1 hypothetical protein FKR81_20135 [Lentzea tibetensis]
MGRESELADLSGLMRGERLVTLAGPAGVGKTRLAGQLVERVRRSFPGGVHVVELASVSDADRVADAVATATGVEEQRGVPMTESVAAAFGDGKLLLELDNCEHVIDAVSALVETLLHRCPRLVLLTTSREVLNTSAEVVYQLDGLAAPDAVRLFADRSGSGFELTEDNAEEVAALCARLDGLPLAIELTARSVRHRPLPELTAQLDEHLLALTRDPSTPDRRHRSLRAAIDWSYYLLSSGEQAALRRLSVLAGDFGLEAADAVCADLELSVLETLAKLEAKSLVHPAPGDGDVARFRLLDSIRVYGRERLRAHDEEAAAHDRLDSWLCDLISRLIDQRAHALRQQLIDERENVWNAVERARGDTGDRQVLLACALAIATMSVRARDVLSHALEVTDPESKYRGYALLQAAWLVDWQAEPSAPLRFAQEALELERRWERPWMLTRLHTVAAMGWIHVGNSEACVRSLREAERIARSLGDHFSIAASLELLTWNLLCAGEVDQAAELVDELLAAAGASDDPEAMWETLGTAGIIAMQLGDLTTAHHRFTESLRLSGVWPRVGLMVEGLGLIAARSGRAERGLCLLTAARESRRHVENIRSGPVGTWWQDLVAEGVSDALRTVPAGLADAAVARGRALTAVEMVEFALDAAANRPNDTSTHAGTPLSHREQEVAALVAQGLTNAQVAGRLGTSLRTIEAQVRSIRFKLDLGSRAEVAVWVTTHAAGVPSRNSPTLDSLS